MIWIVQKNEILQKLYEIKTCFFKTQENVTKAKHWNRSFYDTMEYIYTHTHTHTQRAHAVLFVIV